MRMKKRKLLIFYLFFCISLFSQNSPDIKKGLAFLKNNNPEKALPIFFAETEKTDGDRKAYLYLSVACIQMQKYSDAVTWLTKGKSLDPTDKYLYSYNLGNACFMQGAYEKALLAYTEATSENSYYPAAFLNKANTEMQLGKQEDALKSYKTYLQLEPMSPQRPSIERMISILQGQEDTRQAEVLRQQAEEKARLEREILRLEQEKALLNKVNEDLANSDSATSVSAGSEDTIDYTEEEGNLE